MTFAWEFIFGLDLDDKVGFEPIGYSTYLGPFVPQIHRYFEHGLDITAQAIYLFPTIIDVAPS